MVPGLVRTPKSIGAQRFQKFSQNLGGEQTDPVMIFCVDPQSIQRISADAFSCPPNVPLSPGGHVMSGTYLFSAGCSEANSTWEESEPRPRMHQLFSQVLGRRDLSRAGDLFSLEDAEIEDCLSQALDQIKVISCSPVSGQRRHALAVFIWKSAGRVAALFIIHHFFFFFLTIASLIFASSRRAAGCQDYLTNDNDQAVVEICITRITTAIRETGSIQRHSTALVGLWESCLEHNLTPQAGSAEDTPHAKIASDITSCILQVDTHTHTHTQQTHRWAVDIALLEHLFGLAFSQCTSKVGQLVPEYVPVHYSRWRYSPFQLVSVGPFLLNTSQSKHLTGELAVTRWSDSA